MIMHALLPAARPAALAGVPLLGPVLAASPPDAMEPDRDPPTNFWARITCNRDVTIWRSVITWRTKPIKWLRRTTGHGTTKTRT